MNDTSLLSNVSGGKSVIDWFGREPNFHDAKIIGICLIQGKTSSISLHAWNTTDTVDTKGYFLTEKHATVKIDFEKVDLVELSDFDFEYDGIVYSLELSGSLASTEVSWTSSVGVEGRIKGSGVSISVSPHQTADV